jgi:hypothetical protein
MLTVKFNLLPEGWRERICIEPNSGCWLWTGALTTGGYPKVQKRPKYLLGHRAIRELFFPPHRLLHHTCETPLCVNPLHLLPVAHEEHKKLHNFVNQNFGKTHCIRGHPLSGENLYVTKRGARNCKLCKLRQKRLQSIKSSPRVN